jgi:DNA-binding winged helix-turn-helix (wHTH) protein
MDVRYVDVRALTTRMNDRRDSQSKDVLFFGPFSLFAAERLLKKADEPIPLGGRALDILIALAERPGEVVTHKELISTVWPDVTVEEANLRFQMAALRKALGDGRDGARYWSRVLFRRSGHTLDGRPNGSGHRDRHNGTSSKAAAATNGRDDTVRALAQQLQMWRFVSVVGPGGVAKTTVAI